MEYWTFAYGSLVNKSTWGENGASKPATLKGYQRAWQHIVTPMSRHSPTALTINKEPGSLIDGLLVKVSEDDMAYLKDRETGYDIAYLEPNDFNDLAIDEIDGKIFTHISNPEHHNWANSQHPILQSYIDAVLHGYYKEFNDDGLQRFIETTKGWHLPILNDRHDPQYPRAQRIDISFLDKIDMLIQAAAESAR